MDNDTGSGWAMNMENQGADQTEIQGLVQEAAKLAKALSDPGNASAAKAIQERLHALQKSTAGWAVADGLLGHDDPNVRFFGALTLTMRIHQDWDRLSEEKANDLLTRLIDSFILMVDRQETPFVLRKFFTCMTAFFFKPNAPWTYCMRHIAVSTANGKYVLEEQADKTTFEQLALPSLCHARLMAVLHFSTILAEESSRYSTASDGPAGRLGANVGDALFLIHFSFQRATNGRLTTDESSEHIVRAAIKSLHNWLNAMRTARTNAKELSALVGPILDYTMQLLMVPSLASSSMEILTEILVHHRKLFEARHIEGILDFLISPQAEQYAMALLNGDNDPEMLRFLELLTQYAADKQVDILISTPTEKHGKVLFLLFKLLHGQGFAVVEDGVILHLIEFWTEAAENINDLLLDGGLDDINETIQRNFVQVILECHDKLQYPDPETLKGWDDDDKSLFNEFRRDFTDFLLASYPLIGLEIIQRLQEAAVEALNNRNWVSFEVSLFCLASLAEAVVENEHADDILRTLFHSPGFNDVWVGQTEIPLKARQTLADVIAKFTPYFNRDHVLLPPILNFLFSSLEAPQTAHTASKSISALCQACRKSLLAHAEEFVEKFYQLQARTAISAHTIERVAEGVAAVVEAVPSDTSKASLLIKLLNPLYEQAVFARQEKRNERYDTGLATALMVVRCTASIGKGLRSPEDSVINLDEEEAPEGATFWTTDELGKSAQSLIVCILDVVMSEFSEDGEIIETICSVLKAGYTEQSAGPYVLPAEVTVRFVKAVSIHSPRFPTVMGTASGFLSSYSTHASEVANQVMDLNLHVYQLIRYMEHNPENYDPEVAHGCIDYAKRLLFAYKDTFYALAQPQPDGELPVRTILGFTLATIMRPDPLPLRAACSFWVTFLMSPSLPTEFTPSVESSMQREQTNGAPRLIDPYMSGLGEVLIHQIAGSCARSDLDSLCEVVKKFVFKHYASARISLGNALQHLNVQKKQGNDADSSVSQVERERFLSSVLTLRGARGTYPVVRDFWVLCRGEGFGYTA